MAKATAKDVEDVVEETIEELSKEEMANKAVKKYLLWSMAAGAAPVLVDSIAVGGVQIKMLHSLAKIYEVPFSENSGKSVIASLVGGIGSGAISRSALCSLLKVVPVVGPVMGTAALPAIAGGTTYAVGKLFIQHFESGGTFLNFDPSKVKDQFKKYFKEGKEVAENVEKETDK